MEGKLTRRGKKDGIGRAGCQGDDNLADSGEVGPHQSLGAGLPVNRAKYSGLRP